MVGHQTFLIWAAACVVGWPVVCMSTCVDLKKYSSKFIFYISCLVFAFGVWASMFWHCVFSSWQPFLVVGFCCGAKRAGKQRWQLKHLVRYPCSLSGFRQRETLARVSSSWYHLIIDKSLSISWEYLNNTSLSVNDDTTTLSERQTGLMPRSLSLGISSAMLYCKPKLHASVNLFTGLWPPCYTTSLQLL